MKKKKKKKKKEKERTKSRRKIAKEFLSLHPCLSLLKEKKKERKE